MEMYTYASVQVGKFGQEYSYISDDPHIKVGSYVLVPFGTQNEEWPGLVKNILFCPAEEAPFPVEKTKHILREIPKEDYEAALPSEDFTDWDAEEVREMTDYLDNPDGEYDYDYLLDWACDHHDLEASENQLRTVIRCYELCAERQMPVACLNLGTFYYNGGLLPRDFKKAAALYKIAADSGIEVAIRNLGYCYYYGRHQAVDYAKAYDCFVKSALCFDDANSLYKLGDMYRDGQAVEKNEKYAYLLYARALKSAKRNREYAFAKPDIYYRLGVCRLRGSGTPADTEAAHRALQKALDGFYARRKTDPFVAGLIAKTKKLLEEAESRLDEEILR